MRGLDYDAVAIVAVFAVLVLVVCFRSVIKKKPIKHSIMET